MTKLYPVTIDVKVHITDGDSSGAATYGMGLHKLPAEVDMPGIIEKVMSSVPEGFRLMSRQESTMYFLREARGYRGPNMIVPALAEGEEWHDPATANSYSDLGDEPDLDEEVEF